MEEQPPGQEGGQGHSLTPTVFSPTPPFPHSRVEETGVVLSLEQTEQHTRRPPQRGTSSQKGIPGNSLGMDQGHCFLRTPRRKVKCIHMADKALWDRLLPVFLSLAHQTTLIFSRHSGHATLFLFTAFPRAVSLLRMLRMPFLPVLPTSKSEVIA